MGRTRLRGLSIAGVEIGIEVPERCEWDWPESGVADHACPPRDPEVHVGVRVAELGATDLGGERYAFGASIFEVARRGDDWLIALSRAGRRQQIAVFASDFRVGEVLQSPEIAAQRRYPLAGGLDEWIVLQRTVAKGGLWVTGHARAIAGGAQIVLGEEAGTTRSWRVAPPSLLGRQTLILADSGRDVRVHRSPWNGTVDEALGLEARVVELSQYDESGASYRETLDPEEAAELLASHAVLPLSDDQFLDRALRSARRLSEQVKLTRVGKPERSARPAALPRIGLPGLLTPLLGVI